MAERSKGKERLAKAGIPLFYLGLAATGTIVLYSCTHDRYSDQAAEEDPGVRPTTSIIECTALEVSPALKPGYKSKVTVKVAAGGGALPESVVVNFGDTTDEKTVRQITGGKAIASHRFSRTLVGQEVTVNARVDGVGANGEPLSQVCPSGSLVIGKNPKS